MIHRDISDNKYQMDSLDGLRGFAALIVVFSHTSISGMYFFPFLDLKGIGKSGVFLFFLLSSFLLTLPLLRKGKEVLSFPAMSHYWQRRFFRIYPLYTLYLLFGVTSTYFMASTLGESGVGIPFELDWAGFFNHIALQEGKGVTWSIAVEFKFYFILPFLVLAIIAARSYGPRVTILFFVLLLALSQVISPQEESLLNDARLLPYMPIFIIGMFLAVLQDHIRNGEPNNAAKRVFKYLGYVGMAGVIAMTPLVYSLLGNRVAADHFHRQFILYATLWALILLSSVNAPGLIQRFFTMPVLRFYGALSFSLYLFHPIFIRAAKRLEMNGYLSAWLVLLGATAAAYVSFRLLEGPISKYKVGRNVAAPITQATRRFTRTK